MSNKEEVFVTVLWLFLVNSSLASDDCAASAFFSGPNISGGVNIDTSNVTAVEENPLVKSVSLKGRTLLCNTGEKLIQYPIDAGYLIATATGGLLCDEIYYFCKREYFWSLDRTKNAGSTIDNIGCALQMEDFFYNSRYNCCEEAVNAGDDLLDIVTCYNPEGFCENPLYDEFAQSMQNVFQCNTCVEVNESEFRSEYVNECRPYYGYRSTFFSTDFGKNVSYKTIRPSITAKIPISIKQYSTTFGALKDCSNRSYSRSVGIKNYPGEFNVYEGCELKIKTVP